MEKGDVKKASSLMMTAVFAGFLIFFTLGFIVIPFQGINFTEQRNYAPMPEISSDALLSGSYSKGLEQYLKDHLALRPELVTLCSELKTVFGRTVPDIVFRGKDGQFFLRNNTIDTELKKVAGEIRAFAEKQDVPVDMLIDPDAAAILTDKLPFAYVGDNEDEIADYFLKQAGGNLKVYYSKDRIAELRDSGMKTFYRTDQHWTTDCAHGVLDWYLSESGQPPLTAEYTENETASFFGNLYSGSPGFFDETETLKYYVNPDGEYHVKELDTGLERDSLYDMTWDSGIRNRYNVFLGGHFINTHITSNAKGGKALLLGDSYLMALVPFLADCYSEIRVLDMRQFGERGKTVAELIGDFKPDRILFVNTVYQLSCGASGGIK